MPLCDAPNAMAKWPLDWRLGGEVLAQSVNLLGALGVRVWDNGRFLLPSPFGLESMHCRLETWKPGLVLRFRDLFSPVILSWQEWQSLGSPGQGQTLIQKFTQRLIEASHPLRFSPYDFREAGEGMFVGRKAELALLLSPLPGLVVEGAPGMGKTSLLIHAGRRAEVPVICCQAFSVRDLEHYLTQLSKSGRMPSLLLLDEMDALIEDSRTLQLLAKLNRRGIVWRAAVHRVTGRGPTLKLPAPKGLELLLNPLAKISGEPLSLEVKEQILQAAEGNPRSLQSICHYILLEMGQSPRRITTPLVRRGVEKAKVEEGWAKVG